MNSSKLLLATFAAVSVVGAASIAVAQTAPPRPVEAQTGTTGPTTGSTTGPTTLPTTLPTTNNPATGTTGTTPSTSTTTTTPSTGSGGTMGTPGTPGTPGTMQREAQMPNQSTTPNSTTTTTPRAQDGITTGTPNSTGMTAAERMQRDGNTTGTNSSGTNNNSSTNSGSMVMQNGRTRSASNRDTMMTGERPARADRN